MTRAMHTIGVTAAVLMLASTAWGQTLTKGTLSGKLFTASATITGAGTVPVYTAPSAGNGFAIITQVCGGLLTASGSDYLVGSTIGALGVGTGSSLCTDTMIPLPADEVVSFEKGTAGGEYRVTINGVISKK